MFTHIPRSIVDGMDMINGAKSVKSANKVDGVSPSLRRVPVQERSAARVARMLDSCAELIDEIGYDGLTTTILAERAQVAIGSVYQFFPDKNAVVRELINRNLEAYLQKLDKRLESESFDTWWDVVEAASDEYICMYQNTVGFRALRVRSLMGMRGLANDSSDFREIANRIVAAINGFVKEVDQAKTAFAITIAVEILDTLVTRAFHGGNTGDPRIIAECRFIMREYLGNYLV